MSTLKLSKRRDLACWLSVYADAIEAEKKMPRPSQQVIERNQRKWNETAVALANYEMGQWRRRLNKPPAKV